MDPPGVLFAHTYSHAMLQNKLLQTNCITATLDFGDDSNGYWHIDLGTAPVNLTNNSAC